MNDKVISFKKKQAEARQKKAKAATLCRNGHHDWQVLKDQKFDSQKGKLVTVFQCAHCKKQKVKAL